MIEIIMAWLVNYGMLAAGGTIGAAILGWVLKKIPNEKISGAVFRFFHGLGVFVTLGMSKRLKFWNKIIEPWVVDLLDNTVAAAVKGFIAGLRSDNGAP